MIPGGFYGPGWFFMIPGGFSWFFTIPGRFFMVPVCFFMVSVWIFMVFGDPRSGFLRFQVVSFMFHDYSWLQVIFS